MRFCRPGDPPPSAHAGGYFRDFAMVVRSTADYEGVLDAALEKGGDRLLYGSEGGPAVRFSSGTGAVRSAGGGALGDGGYPPFAENRADRMLSRSLSLLENYVFYGASTAKNGGRSGPGIPTVCLRRRIIHRPKAGAPQPAAAADDTAFGTAAGRSVSGTRAYRRA